MIPGWLVRNWGLKIISFVLAVGLWYYARIIKTMYLEEPTEPGEIAVSPVFRVVFVALAAATVVLGVYWRPLTDAATAASRILSY